MVVKNLKTFLEKQGVKFLYNTEVTGFELEKDNIKSIKIEQKIGEKSHISYIISHTFVVATGSWSPQLTKMLNIGLPMQTGKGYNVTYEQNEGKKLNIPSILLN